MDLNTLDVYIAGLMAWAPRWLVATAVGLAIILGGFALQALALWIAGRFIKTWDVLAQFIYYRVRRVARFAIILLAANFALPLMPLSQGAVTMAGRILLAAFILLIGYIVYMAVNIAITRYVNNLHFDSDDNLLARKAATQMRLLRRAINILIALATLGFALMSFDAVRQFGVSLFASAGVAGLVAGLAARPVLSNLIAGMQLAVTQPIRLDDVVVVEGEWGRIEEFTATYVVVRIWDLRRLIVPLSYFLETPFRNWSYSGSQILGTVYLYTDYTVPVAKVREKAIELIRNSPLWDGQTAGLVVTDAKEHTLEMRALMSAADSSKVWDLRCAVREGLIDFIQREYPHALPRTRAEIAGPPEPDLRAPAPPASSQSGQTGQAGTVPGISQSTDETRANNAAAEADAAQGDDAADKPRD